MVEVYLAYSSEDKKFVDKLRSDLIEARFAVKEYEQQVLEAKAILLPVFSNNFTKASLPDFQWLIYSSQHDIRVTPITIDQGKVPSLWSNMECIEFKNSYDVDLEILIGLLSSRETKNAKPSSADISNAPDTTKGTEPLESETNPVEKKAVSSDQNKVTPRPNRKSIGVGALGGLFVIAALYWGLSQSSDPSNLDLSQKPDSVPMAVKGPVVDNPTDSITEILAPTQKDSAYEVVMPIVTVVPPPDSAELLAKKMEEVKNRIVQDMMDKN